MWREARKRRTCLRRHTEWRQLPSSASGRRFQRKLTLRLTRRRDNSKTSRWSRDGEDFVATPRLQPAIATLMFLDDGTAVPDPVSRLLPYDVHGPTGIVDPEAVQWSDRSDHWRGLDLRDYVIYELHVGTFTPEGTFDGAISKLDYLRQLGMTVIEIMPVAAFPGTRNWGYDGVSPYAVQASYGGPDGLKRLVDAAHNAGLAVILDVVYNHLGPEGNYLPKFGPYFTVASQNAVGRRHQLRQRML